MLFGIPEDLVVIDPRSRHGTTTSKHVGSEKEVNKDNCINKSIGKSTTVSYPLLEAAIFEQTTFSTWFFNINYPPKHGSSACSMKQKKTSMKS